MKKYRKKPVVVEAMQYDGTVEGFIAICENFKLERDASNSFKTLNNKSLYYDTTNKFIIQTYEGLYEAKKNDYIIKGITKEYYPCKPDIFEKTYEEVT